MAEDQRRVLAFVRRERERHVRDRDVRSSVDPTVRSIRWKRHARRWPRRSSSSRSSARRSTASTTATSPPRAEPPARPTPNLDAVVESRSRTSRSGPASSCSGAPPTCSATRVTCTGAATSPNADVFAYAAAQVKKALEVTQRPGRRELRLLGRPRGLLTAPQHRPEARARSPRPLPPPGRRLQEADRLQRAVLIEPKPKEPTKHQYDFDAAVCLNFLARLRSRRRLQAQPRDQPRDARRPHDDARARVRRRPTACSARSTPTAATRCSAGTPTSSRPSTPHDCRCMRSSSAWRARRPAA